jgi:hypothetical protein
VCYPVSQTELIEKTNELGDIRPRTANSFKRNRADLFVGVWQVPTPAFNRADVSLSLFWTHRGIARRT